MRIEQVTYFLEIVNEGSFARAAEKLHIHHTSLRESITKLENDLGNNLFTRSSKGVELTTYGRYCLPHFQLILDSYNRMKFPGILGEAQKKLKIELQGSYDPFCNLFYSNLHNVLNDCVIEIHFNEDVNAGVHRLLQGESDLYFILELEGYEEKNSYYDAIVKNNISSSILSYFDISVRMRKDHPLAKKKEIFYEDIIQYQLIHSSPSEAIKPYLDVKKDKLNTVTIFSDKTVQNYLNTSYALSFMVNVNDANTETLVIRPVKKMPRLVFKAIYKNGNMNDMLLRCINTMKRELDNIKN